MQVPHSLDQGIGLQPVVAGSEVLVPDTDGHDGGGRYEGENAVGEPLLGGGGVLADVDDVAVLDGDEQVDSGVGKSLEDVGVGVVDLYLVNEGRLEELRHLLGRREVAPESAVVDPNGGGKEGRAKVVAVK